MKITKFSVTPLRLVVSRFRGGYAFFMITLMLSVISPFPALLMQSLMITFSKRNIRKILAVTSIIPISFWLSAINSTKQIDGDLINYKIMFDDAKNYNLLLYMAKQTREPLYALYDYIFSNTLEVNFAGFVFFTTLFGYLLILGSIAQLSRTKTVSYSAIVVLVFLIAFFPPLFSISAHILRQFFAGSILVVVMSTFFMTGRVKSWLIVVAALIHTSAAIFLIIPVLHWLKVKVKINSFPLQIMLVVLPFLGINFVTSIIAEIPILSSLSYVQYAVQRASQVEFFGLERMSVSAISFVITTGVLSSCLVFVPLRQFSVPMKQAVLTLSAFVSGICILVVLLYVAKINEPATRLTYYLYFALPFVIIIYLNNFPRVTTILMIFSVWLLPTLFILSYPHNGWVYANPLETMFYPVISYDLFAST